MTEQPITPRRRPYLGEADWSEYIAALDEDGPALVFSDWTDRTPTVGVPPQLRSYLGDGYPRS